MRPTIPTLSYSERLSVMVLELPYWSIGFARDMRAFPLHARRVYPVAWHLNIALHDVVVHSLREHYGTIADMVPTGEVDGVRQLTMGQGRLAVERDDLRSQGWRGVLCVTADAPYEVVRAAYKALMLMYHEDMGGEKEKAQEINAAWEEAEVFYRKVVHRA